MPILAQDLANEIRFALDAEGSDHYRDDRDIIPAINVSLDWLSNIVNTILGEKKYSEEILRDLTKTRVFRTSKDSRIKLSAFPHEVWTILAVYPKPVTGIGDTAYPLPNVTDKDSFERKDLYHITSDYSAKRLTLEEWINNKKNPFEAGNEVFTCPELIEYAYLSPNDYNWNGDENNTITEIEIRPLLNKELCSVTYAKVPDKVTQLTDFIEYPREIFSLLFNKALQYISYKQGDETNLYTVTEDDIRRLINTLV